MNLLAPALLAALLLCAASARAQNGPQISAGPPCQTHRPSDLPCPSAAIVAPETDGDLRDRTHSMILPTGNLLGKGETQVQLNELALYDRIAYGVSDRVEINVGMFVPLAISAGLKIALIEPKGAFRLVAGATLWKATLGDRQSETLLQGGVTAAYQGDAINVHATLEMAQRFDGDSETFGGYALGALGRVSAKVALSAELLRMGLPQSGACCIDALVVGAKLMGASWDFDLGVATPLEQQSSAMMFPIIAASTKL